MLSKEECEKALSEIEYSLCELEEIKTGVDVYCLFDENLEIVKWLIKEHFDINPYKYAELKKGMLVWDDSIKTTVKISTTFKNKGRRIVRIKYEEKYFSIEFEEGRFFPITKANQ